MTAYKKLIAGFGCRNGKAVLDGKESACDIVKLAQQCSDNGADELMICDLSKTDGDHEDRKSVV